MEELMEDVHDENVRTLRYCKMYYCILLNHWSTNDVSSGREGNASSSRRFDGCIIEEKGCIISSNLVPSLHDAINEINVDRRKERDEHEHGDVGGSSQMDSGESLINLSETVDKCQSEASADPIEGAWLTDTEKNNAMPDPLDFFGVLVASQHAGDQCNVSSLHDPFSVFSPSTQDELNNEIFDDSLHDNAGISHTLSEPRSSGDQSPTKEASSREDCRNKVDTMTHIIPPDDLNPDELLAFTKVYVMNCIEGISSVNVDVNSGKNSLGIHNDVEDKYALWVPVQHLYEPLTFYKEGEIHLKFELKNGADSMKSQSITTVEEIDRIISSPTVCPTDNQTPDALFESTNWSTFGMSLGVSGTASQSSVQRVVQREPSDDFGSLLDESFHYSRMDDSIPIYRRVSSGYEDYVYDMDDLFYSADNASNDDAFKIRSEIMRWAYDTGDVIKDIRTLLYTLPQVLWPGARWNPIDISVCADDRHMTRRCYRSAMLLCHPDKHMRSDWRTALRAQIITQSLQESWSMF